MDEKILVVQVVDRRIVLHTEDKPYVGPTLKQLDLLLRQLGFQRANANQFVRMEEIVRRDKRLMRVYLNKELTKFVNVTRSNKNKFFP